jgi:hypothetical protein
VAMMATVTSLYPASPDGQIKAWLLGRLPRPAYLVIAGVALYAAIVFIASCETGNPIARGGRYFLENRRGVIRELSLAEFRHLGALALRQSSAVFGLVSLIASFVLRYMVKTRSLREG